MFNIGYVQKKTGLTGHVLRVWERRHQAVIPERTETNRRLYTPEQLERLQLLALLTRHEHTISQLAHLSTQELHTLVEQDQFSSDKITQISSGTPAHIDKIPSTFSPLLHAISNYDQPALDHHLDLHLREYGYSGLLEKIIAPLMKTIGELWHRGDFTTAQEHAATSFIKEYLAHRVGPYSPEKNAPTLIATTPAGQLHELGAYFASCHAVKLGWRTIYLGPALPADEIAGAAIHSGAKAILLGIQYPADDPLLPNELHRLHHQLRDSPTSIIIGGSSANSYQSTIKKINAHTINNFNELTHTLQKIREKNSPPLNSTPQCPLATNT